MHPYIIEVLADEHRRDLRASVRRARRFLEEPVLPACRERRSRHRGRRAAIECRSVRTPCILNGARWWRAATTPDCVVTTEGASPP
jgi:hypothetical protein